MCTPTRTPTISGWWTNTIAPAFEAANPDYRINVVITGGSRAGNDR